MWRDGSKIGSFQVGANLIGQMNCCKYIQYNSNFSYLEVGTLIIFKIFQIALETTNTSKKRAWVLLYPAWVMVIMRKLKDLMEKYSVLIVMGFQ